MSESEGNSKITTDIPFLFYDVIGRMMPGAYLIFGILACSIPFLTRQKLACLHQAVQAYTPESAVAISIIGILVVLFFCASAFCGFLLASLSYLLVEEPWTLCSPLDYTGMKDFLGTETATSIRSRFKGKFEIELENFPSLNRPSFVCAYYIWRADVNLGQMQGRQDADLLAARSFVLVTIILGVFSVCETIFYGQAVPYWRLAVLTGIGICSFLAFKYHRKKRVYDRFEMFLALSDSTPATPGLEPLSHAHKK